MRHGPIWIILGLALVLGVAVQLTYKGTDLWGPRAEDQGQRVVLIVKTTDFNISFWKSLRDGALLAAQESGLHLEVLGPRDEVQVDEQIRLLERTVQERPAAIVLAAADYRRLIPGIRKARAAGIPVVTVDSFVSSQDANTKIGTDNVALGVTCAQALLEWVPKGALVGVVNFTRDSSTARDREQGLLTGLGSSVRVLPTQYSGADAEVAYELTKTLLAQYPGLSGLVALNEPTTLGVSRALKESGRAAQVSLVGVDQSFALLKRLEDGTIRNLLVQQPFNMGYLGVRAARTLSQGGVVDPLVDTGSVNIDRHTMYLPRNQKLLFPFSD